MGANGQGRQRTPAKFKHGMNANQPKATSRLVFVCYPAAGLSPTEGVKFYDYLLAV